MFEKLKSALKALGVFLPLLRYLFLLSHSAFLRLPLLLSPSSHSFPLPSVFLPPFLLLPPCLCPSHSLSLNFPVSLPPPLPLLSISHLSLLLSLCLSPFLSLFFLPSLLGLSPPFPSPPSLLLLSPSLLLLSLSFSFLLSLPLAAPSQVWSWGWGGGGWRRGPGLG